MIFDKPLRVNAYELDTTTQRLLIRVIAANPNFINLKVGDLLIARGKDRHVYYSTKAFYIYDLDTAKGLGCFKVSNFEIIGQFDTLEVLQQHVQEYGLQQATPTMITPQVEEPSIMKINNENEDDYGQLSLFDF